MAYRDELEAAQQHATSLRERVAELEQALERDSRVTELEQQVEALEANLIAAAAPPPRRALELTSWMPAGAVVALWGLAFLCVTQPREAGAWELANLAVVVGVVGTAWSWGRTGKLGALVGATVVKIVTLLVWMAGWWGLTRDTIRQVDSSLGLFDADFYFFWAAPPFVLTVALVEGFFIRRALAAGRTRGSGSPSPAL